MPSRRPLCSALSIRSAARGKGAGPVVTSHDVARLAGVSPADGLPGTARQPQGQRRDQATGARGRQGPWLRPERDRPSPVQRAHPADRVAADRPGEPVLPARDRPDPPRARGTRLPAGAADRDHRHRDGGRTAASPTGWTASCWPPPPSTPWCRCGCATAACRSSTSTAPLTPWRPTRPTVDPAPGMSRGGHARSPELGHRRVGAVFGPRNTSTALQRETALRDSLDEQGLAIASRGFTLPRPVRLRHGLRRRAAAAGQGPAARQ